MDIMGSASESSSANYNMSLPASITSETKMKFNSLLKHATRKKRAQLVSKENLLKSCASNEDIYKLDYIEDKTAIENERENKDYILHKFLGDSTAMKVPIPKPRKKNNTIAKVKILNKSVEDLSGSSNLTYVKDTQSEKYDPNSSGSSENRTFNVQHHHQEVVAEVNHRISSPHFHNKNSSDDNTDTNRPLTDKEKNDNDKTEYIKSDDEDLLKIKSTRDTHGNNNEDEIKNDVILPKPRRRKNKNEIDTIKNEENERKSYSYERIIAIIVHKTDRLLLNSMVIHPVVKIHIVDISTGRYFEKSEKGRGVVFFYENNDNDYISPVMTHPFNLQEKRKLFPEWEETIILNEDYEYLVEKRNDLILFFEILDFVSFSTLQKSNARDCSKGWHNIAFAFLKLSGKNDALNLNRKMRLQLYHSYQSSKKVGNMNHCEAWNWWKKKKLNKYPSSLHISIKPIKKPKQISECLRSKTPVQEEMGYSRTKIVIDNIKTPLETDVPLKHATVGKDKLDHNNFHWSRSSNEICQLPNHCIGRFNSYDEGSLVVKFSNNGLYLAAAVRCAELYCIVVFSIVTMNEITKFSCHQGIIYCIRWSQDDKYLISASGDNTISVIDFSKLSFLQILPHPCFVYSCDINTENSIASGAYDGIIRIWQPQVANHKTEFRLCQELERHKGYITSLCFSKKKLNLYSADSVGLIVEWKNINGEWIFEREIFILDLRETVINQISLFPKEKKFMINSRDNLIRIVDLKSGCVFYWLRGAVFKKFQIYSSITPCGNYIYSGSEDGKVYVWNSKNGNLIHTYDVYNVKNNYFVVHCAEFHPLDNMLAISHYGQDFPILIYRFESSADENKMQEKLNHFENNALGKDLEEKVNFIRSNISGNKLNFRASVLKKIDELVSSAHHENAN